MNSLPPEGPYQGPTLATANEGKSMVTQETINNFIALHAVSYENLSEDIRRREEGSHPELWQIVGSYAGREGRLFFINAEPDPKFAAGRLVELINEAGGRVEAWPPLPKGTDQKDRAWQPSVS